MQEETISMTTITDGFEPHTTTGALYIYKWLAKTMIYKGMKTQDLYNELVKELV